MAEFKKNPAAPYELADLPSNPATEDSDVDSNGGSPIPKKHQHQLNLQSRASHLVSHTLCLASCILMPHILYLTPCILASHTFTPRILYPRASHPVSSRLTSHIFVSRIPYLAPRALTPHNLPLCNLYLICCNPQSSRAS
ncbi:hypothetical protein BS47DRAFT_1394977 [Hydnum rufescens UP504]|uniref:Uncharacterized protein n=1 Tax=Hydnum rufescens UP504 TaxID=1448309 RepID=A0A9P6DVE3_9AGAM|nr:hypothetical protein BS47DRAFT_1394977 [Hydnum rufescens UP504]